MKKILFLAAPFEHYKGGSEYQYKVIESKLSDNYEITYLFRHPEKLENRKYIAYNYKFRSKYNQYNYSDYIQIYKLIKKIKPDIIYKRGLNYITSVGVLYSKLNNCSSIVHIASEKDLEGYKFSPHKSTFFECIDKQLNNYSINKADFLITQSKTQNSTLKKRFERKADLVLFNLHPIPSFANNKTNIFTVVWISNIKSLKRPDLFITLAKEFQNDSGIHFVMVGRPGREDLQKEVSKTEKRQKNFTYSGELELEEINELMSTAHVLVNTSDYEGFPNTFIQAFMHKVPVISLNVDPDDLLKKEQIGFHSKNLNQMKKDLLILKDNPEKRKKMGEKARLFSIKQFGIDNNIDQLIRVFDRAN